MIQEPDFPYFPREAAYQLHILSCELENYSVAQESNSWRLKGSEEWIASQIRRSAEVPK